MIHRVPLREAEDCDGSEALRAEYDAMRTDSTAVTWEGERSGSDGIGQPAVRERSAVGVAVGGALA